MSIGTDHRLPGRKLSHRHLFLSAFGLILALGFGGILWTVDGAAGHRYYWALRLPITVCVLVGMFGTFVCSIPFFNRLAVRAKPATEEPAESEEELQARAERLCACLPLFERATSKTKAGCLGMLILSIAGMWWGYRTNRFAVLLSAAVGVIVFLWQTARAFAYRAEFAVDCIRYRTFRGLRTRPYSEVLEVAPGYQAREVRIWFADGTKLTLYAERLRPTDILLIVTERQSDKAR